MCSTSYSEDITASCEQVTLPNTEAMNQCWFKVGPATQRFASAGMAPSQQVTVFDLD